MLINTRNIRKNDLEALHNITLESWYKKEAEEDTELTNALVQIDLNTSLNKSSFGKVAVVDGQVIGVIMGSVEAQPNELRLLQTSSTPSWLTILEKDENQRAGVLQDLRFEVEAQRKLITKYTANDYGGSIVLFAVHPEFKGQGVGSLLFEEMMQHFSNHMINKYYLFSDSMSDISYYDHRGLRQLDSAVREDGHVIYLYDYNFHNE